MTKPAVGEGRRLIRRRVVRGAVVGGAVGAVWPLGGVIGLVPPELVEPFERWWWLGVSVLLGCSAVGTWIGMQVGRTDGIREAALEPGEAVLSAYAVRPPVVDGRPTRPTELDRFELRLTNRGLQLWDGPGRLWSHPWSEVRLTTVKGSLLLVHHGDQEIAELLPVPETIGWDALLLGARRMRAASARSR
ncbi:hypothetical protein AB0B30_33340 [Streptomyces narbonensis]|uniref:Uncharacterized protein n=1 Tax=Streptomyces narbonensis TaxID=67333 RepID=A0ABV3CJK8_9ACTN